MFWFGAVFSIPLWELVIAQASPPSLPVPSPIDPATVELLKNQLQFLQDANTRLTSSFDKYVTLISLVTALFVGVGAWFFKQTLSEAKQEVDQLVKAEVKREIARTVKSRVDYLEQVLQREEVPSLVTIDYVLQNTSGTLPFEYRLLNSRFPRLKARKLENRKFDADVVVLDLVEFQPAGAELTNEELADLLHGTQGKKGIKDKIQPEAVLVIYVKGSYPTINSLSCYYVPANGRIRLLSAVTDASYLAYALRSEDT